MTTLASPSAADLPHDDYGPQLVALSCALLLAAALFLVLRIVLKIVHRRGLWWDDYLLVAAWLVLTAAVVLNIVDVGYGYGRHSWDVDPVHIPAIVTNGTLSGTLVLLAACWSKTSFAFTLLRLPIGWMRPLVWTIIVTLNVSMHLSALSIWIECPAAPPSVSGLGIDTGDRLCIPIPLAVQYGIAVGGYSAAVDFVLALLPWKILWNLQMQRREKMGVLIAMSMGVFAGLSAAIKTTKIATLESPDIIDSVQLAAWGMAEVDVTIMAASIPILRALFRPGTSRRAPNMNNWDDIMGVTAAQRRGAAAAAAAAANVACSVSTDAAAAAIATAPMTSPPEKRWPLLTPKSVRFPSLHGSGRASHTSTKEDLETDFDFDAEDDDLKKPAAPRSSIWTYVKSPRSSV
ncbi:uncharacterized protein SPSK_01738 [Sporothrix schenckii 1099-18]|uniref:Rhodopsin domain-containing protein n=1 Tax=Sporothrix schenckii 1099-18 TaxID=1397361 RepID=A0A0F2MDX7_SPOSC|nr:uncharacterized protein SPSK_01738 [Sporothrix schenckii 1099-18]KJR87294.1 hypothetical protein SPSK_01738 [Sporothrix schenckii 1099-18]